MVTVITRPQGHKIIDQAISALAFSSFYFDAEESVLINFTAHGLSNGDYVYVVSDIDEYNGFWEVEVFNVNAFYLTEGGQRVEFYQEIDIEYYQTQEHDWSSIFLPIVYKCSNDRWPINSVDASRTISSFADDNGYSDFTLSGDIKSSGGGINALEFVKITGASDDDLNGVWQIVEVVSNSRIVINLPYDSTNSFAGATIQYYYNNYQVKVKIFAGLNGSHPWVAKKPYTEVAELSLTPDDNNEVMFSVSDYIKIKVAIKNNLTLFSLPLNLDAFTGFYISLAESFDDSDNYSLTTNESSFVVDEFEGYAIAGKLPFKNVYSGDYADYVYTSGSPALWLTNHARLLAVEGYFFDVSFIKNITGEFLVRITKYVGDYGLVEDVLYSDQGIGVYRIPITPDANYDSFCIKVYVTGEIELSNSDFANNPGSGTDWTTGANPSVTRSTTGNSDSLFDDYDFAQGLTYTITGEFTVTGTFTGQIILRITDDSFGVIFSDTTSFASAGAKTASITFTATEDSENIVIIGAWLSNDLGTITLDSIVLTIDELPITEEICIDILETCESINQFTQEARRLLEDGGYRLLE